MPSNEGLASSIVLVPEPNDPRPTTFEDPALESESKFSPSSVIRDEDYYWLDGNCIIRAEDRLFKIHRYLLERDSVFFRTLFTLPQPGSDDSNQEFTGQRVEGQSDENPIVCQDSADDFKALCWILYAGPKEICAQEKWRTMDMAKLLRVTILTHKYEFESLRDWLFGVIDANFGAKSSQFIDSCCGWKNVDHFLNICYEFQQITLAERIEQLWLDQIRKPNERRSLRLEAFKAALDAAENSPYLRQFHGKAYYTYLQACNVFNVAPSTNPLLPTDFETADEYVDHFLFTPGKLNGERSARLCQGLFSLMRLRSKLSTVPTSMSSIGKCRQHPSGRGTSWGVSWSTAHKNMELDPGKFLQLQQNIFEDASVSMCSCSRMKVEKKVKDMIKSFDVTLPDQFMIPRCGDNEWSMVEDWSDPVE